MSKTQIVLDENPNDTNTEEDSSMSLSQNAISKTFTLEFNRNEVMEDEYHDALNTFFEELTDQCYALIEEKIQEESSRQIFFTYRIG